MNTLSRAQAHQLWDQYWADMGKEWFKIEVLQDYSGEDDCASLRAWLAGDRQTARALLAEAGIDWLQRCQSKHRAGVLLRRVRIIEQPLTPYTEWELAFYEQVNVPGGEEVFVVDKDVARRLVLPSGDLMVFDNKRAAVCAYDKTGRVTHETFYDERDDISPFLQLTHDLLALARPL
jgi:hypothetical protein